MQIVQYSDKNIQINIVFFITHSCKLHLLLILQILMSFN